MTARGTDELSPELERFAEALAVERVHGDQAPKFIAEQIIDLVMRGEEAGLQRWHQIAERYDRLQPRGQPS